MKYLICLPFILFSLIIGCQDKSTPRSTANVDKDALSFEEISKRNHLKKIEGIALSLKEKAGEKTDMKLAQSLIDESKSFANKYRKHEKTPAILFRAGEVARSIGQYVEAINIFRRLSTQFPADPFAIKALFLEASTFEDGLKDKEKAKIAYQNLIEKYPDDPLAEQARQLLKVIDKSPEELIKEFQKQ